MAAKPLQGHSDEERRPSRPREGGGPYPEDIRCCLQPGAGQTRTHFQPHFELQLTLCIYCCQ